VREAPGRATMKPGSQVQFRAPPTMVQLAFGAPQPTVPQMSLAARNKKKEGRKEGVSEQGMRTWV
jgi:hypothetical protein